MQHDWIIDVLTDLKRFAQINGLPRLSEELDDARVIALQELAIVSAGYPVTGGACVSGCDAAGVRSDM